MARDVSREAFAALPAADEQLMKKAGGMKKRRRGGRHKVGCSCTKVGHPYTWANAAGHLGLQWKRDER